MTVASPEISIIVPVYKVEAYLDRCIMSILAQTFSNFELILVDDGSQDKCPQMCDEWAKKDSRIRVIHKENGGLSSARNVAIPQARGQYVGFVDSDDWIEPEMYSVLYDLIRSGDYGISCCGIYRTGQYSIAGTKAGLSGSKVWSRQDFLKRILKVNCQDSNQYAVNKLYRREVIQPVRYPEGLTDEDVPGTFQAVLQTEKIIETDWVGYYYFENPDSITGEVFSEKKFDFLQICSLILKLAEEYGDPEIIHYAKLFRIRGDFGVLCRMMVFEDGNAPQYREKKRKLIEQVKGNYRQLMACPMPKSRKVLATGIKVNYPLTEKTVQLFYNLRNRSRSSGKEK